MQIFIGDGAHQTFFFGMFLIIVILVTLKSKTSYTPLSLTQELKGFAILTILFGHIGYFLSENQEFLYPFSIMSGTGVNLFLFLSGYGLTISQLKKSESILTFYSRRFGKLFVPFWIVLGSFLALDFILLGKTYSLQFLLQAPFGIFTHADLFTDFNSPFWYFTFILIYYLLFPLLFNKKRVWLTAFLLYFIIKILTLIDLLPLQHIIGNYEVHMLAFPLGVFIAWFIQTQKDTTDYFVDFCKKYANILYPLAIAMLPAFIAYFGIHSDVGKLAYIEQRTSLLIMFAIILFFIIKKKEVQFLSLFGLYSYEIYLLHWPLLYRYDILYKNIPGWLATVIYLGLFIILAIGLQKLSSAIPQALLKVKNRIANM